jgi:hypothetical protein
MLVRRALHILKLNINTMLIKLTWFMIRLIKIIILKNLNVLKFSIYFKIHDFKSKKILIRIYIYLIIKKLIRLLESNALDTIER